jgi:hypothetical protein
MNNTYADISHTIFYVLYKQRRTHRITLVPFRQLGDITDNLHNAKSGQSQTEIRLVVHTEIGALGNRKLMKLIYVYIYIFRMNINNMLIPSIYITENNRNILTA